MVRDDSSWIHHASGVHSPIREPSMMKSLQLGGLSPSASSTSQAHMSPRGAISYRTPRKQQMPSTVQTRSTLPSRFASPTTQLSSGNMKAMAVSSPALESRLLPQQSAVQFRTGWSPSPHLQDSGTRSVSVTAPSPRPSPPMLGRSSQFASSSLAISLSGGSLPEGLDRNLTRRSLSPDFSTSVEAPRRQAAAPRKLTSDETLKTFHAFNKAPRSLLSGSVRASPRRHQRPQLAATTSSSTSSALASSTSSTLVPMGSGLDLKPKVEANGHSPPSSSRVNGKLPALANPGNGSPSITDRREAVVLGVTTPESMTPRPQSICSAFSSPAKSSTAMINNGTKPASLIGTSTSPERRVESLTNPTTAMIVPEIDRVPFTNPTTAMIVPEIEPISFASLPIAMIVPEIDPISVSASSIGNGAKAVIVDDEDDDVRPPSLTLDSARSMDSSDSKLESVEVASAFAYAKPEPSAKSAAISSHRKTAVLGGPMMDDIVEYEMAPDAAISATSFDRRSVSFAEDVCVVTPPSSLQESFSSERNFEITASTSTVAQFGAGSPQTPIGNVFPISDDSLSPSRARRELSESTIRLSDSTIAIEYPVRDSCSFTASFQTGEAVEEAIVALAEDRRENIADVKTAVIENETVETAGIDGRWTKASISGTVLTWNCGITSVIEIVDGRQFTMKWNHTLACLPAKVYTAVLEDDGKLHWSDGDIWVRKAAIPGGKGDSESPTRRSSRRDSRFDLKSRFLSFCTCYSS